VVCYSGFLYILYSRALGACRIGGKMETSKQIDKTTRNLIGTNWIAVETVLDNKSTIEIIDEKYCIYSSQNNFRLRTYKISEGQILIGDSVSYAIRGNTFFYNGIPIYKKEERPPSIRYGNP
jgi:hypothetical protein